MNDRLAQSQKRLHDSLFELYIDGGLELYLSVVITFGTDSCVN
jgi:hypothetical protein